MTRSRIGLATGLVLAARRRAIRFVDENIVVARGADHAINRFAELFVSPSLLLGVFTARLRPVDRQFSPSNVTVHAAKCLLAEMCDRPRCAHPARWGIRNSRAAGVPIRLIHMNRDDSGSRIRWSSVPASAPDHAGGNGRQRAQCHARPSDVAHEDTACELKFRLELLRILHLYLAHAKGN